MHDKGKRYNSDLLEAIELGFLLSWPRSPSSVRAQPQGIRGGHAREDYPNRDDTKLHAHTMAYKQGADLICPSDIRLDYKPVVQTRYEPMGGSTDDDPPESESPTSRRFPDGAVMVTLKIRPLQPENPTPRASRASGCPACRPTGARTCCSTSRGYLTAP